MEHPLEEAMATRFNILAWKIPWTEEPDGVRSIGSQRVGHNKNDLARHRIYVHMCWMPEVFG